jgi:hypothetical protein
MCALNPPTDSVFVASFLPSFLPSSLPAILRSCLPPAQGCLAEVSPKPLTEYVGGLFHDLGSHLKSSSCQCLTLPSILLLFLTTAHTSPPRLRYTPFDVVLMPCSAPGTWKEYKYYKQFWLYKNTYIPHAPVLVGLV